MNLTLWRVFAVLCLLSLCLAIGCSGGEGEPGTDDSAVVTDDGAAVQAVLAKADAADGTVDKVISKCVTCMLTMDGKPDHSATYGEYTVHLCSEECEETFTANPEKALAALRFPESK